MPGSISKHTPTSIAVGIVGRSGRMGTLLAEILQQHPGYTVGPGYSQESSGTGRTLSEVFETNDIVVDFSNATLTPQVARVAKSTPKPLIVGVTGLDFAEIYKSLSNEMPILLAPNTSVGAWLQRRLSVMAVKALTALSDSIYDVDILDVHHKAKVDAPSGSAKTLAASLSSVMAQGGPQPIITSQRRGHYPGLHRVTFTGPEDEISISHTVFNRMLFARSVIPLLNWLLAQGPGLYILEDVYGQDLAG